VTRSNDEASDLLRGYFGSRLERYGRDPRGVDWQSGEAQTARFAAVLTAVRSIGDLDGATLLDAGCGLGDFNGFLVARDVEIRYTGCDLSEPHIAAARAAYPSARFVAAGVRDFAARESFDYTVACGLMHLRVPRWPRWSWGLVRAMYAGSRRGLVFTLPERGAGHPPALATVDRSDWLARVRTLAPGARVYPVDPWGDLVFTLPKTTS